MFTKFSLRTAARLGFRSGNDSDKTFAKPRYWAAFFVFGAPGAGSLDKIDPFLDFVFRSACKVMMRSPKTNDPFIQQFLASQEKLRYAGVSAVGATLSQPAGTSCKGREARKTIIIQLGSTSDDSPAFAVAAHELGFEAWRVDSPDRLNASRIREYFDRSVAVLDPLSVEVVAEKLMPFRASIRGIVPGNDASVTVAHLSGQNLGLTVRAFDDVVVPDKAGQRLLLKRLSPEIAQPAFITTNDVELAISSTGSGSLSFPLVVKPVLGNGGLGVCLVSGESGLKRAMSEIQTMKAWHGRVLKDLIVEEYIAGSPCSVQGTILGGKVHIYSFTSQLVSKTVPSVEGSEHGFDERGHLVRPLQSDDDGLIHLAQAAMSAFRFRNGAFYVDMVFRDGRYYFIEAGFRLSAAGVVSLVNAASGANWAAEVLCAVTDSASPAPGVPLPTPGACVGRVQLRTDRELANILRYRDHFDQIYWVEGNNCGEGRGYLCVGGNARSIAAVLKDCLHTL